MARPNHLSGLRPSDLKIKIIGCPFKYELNK